jgi:hypothetical protein
VQKIDQYTQYIEERKVENKRSESSGKQKLHSTSRDGETSQKSNIIIGERSANFDSVGGR